MSDLRVVKRDFTDSEPWQRIQAVIDPVFDRMRLLRPNRDSEARFLSQLMHGQQLVYLAWILGGEISNGGFAALFYNSTGEFGHEILDALHELGARKQAALLERAIALCPGGRMPTDLDERHRLLLELSEDEAEQTLGTLDTEYFGLEDTDQNLAAYMNTYIDSHPEDFFK